ncbi:MAG: LysE family transporter [Methanomicrobiaceae archaeon]|nr:LysE family transporter [Methanomicrobiaceae archaeon]
MYSALEFFILSFFIGLTGALAPGPTLIATIRASVEKGWTAGPRISAGHVAIEAFLAAIIIFGLSAFAASYTDFIAVFGGVALVSFGCLNIKEGMSPSFGIKGGGVAKSPFAAGVITAVTNPYFWLWWLTIGSGFLLDGIKGGIIMAAAFLAGHWLSDIFWLTSVSAGISHGKKIMPKRVYGKVIAGCGVFLVIFGAYYIISVAGRFF